MSSLYTGSRVGGQFTHMPRCRRVFRGNQTYPSED